MENASKALIIAGAILISILLIGLGVYVYNMAQTATKDVGLQSQAAQTQNNQFMSYFGENKSSADVKNLMNAIKLNNITGKTAEEEKEIFVLFDGAASSTSAISQAVKPGTKYWIGTENDDPLTDASKAGTTVSTSSEAYYDTGYLRVISVYSGGKKKTTP